jgi:hypothetical protein
MKTYTNGNIKEKINIKLLTLKINNVSNMNYRYHLQFVINE